MIERATQIFAASALLLGPVGVWEAPNRPVERAYVRDDERKDKSEIIQMLEPIDSPPPPHPQVKKLGHFVHRSAARNQQMGHRFRG